MKEVAEQPDKQAKLLAELVDKKIEARVSRIESTVAKMYKLFKKIKETSSSQRVDKVESEMQALKQILDDFNVKNLEEDIFKQFNEINKKISLSLDSQKASIEKSEIELSSLKKSLEEAQELQKDIKGLDVKRMKQDVESLKTKTQWIELEFEKMDLRPLIDRINELEARIDAFRISQPMVIE